MQSTFRLSMAWLHTWFGLVLGFVLIVMFFFGSLSCFDREIDRWSVPDTRIAAAPLPSFDRTLLPIFRSIRPDPESMREARGEVIGALPPQESLTASDFSVYTTHRDPVLQIYSTFELPNKPRDAATDHVHVDGHAIVDPRSGALLDKDELRLGTGFFYPMHITLHLTWKDLGIWIVGLSAVAMLAALVTGVVMHRRIFRELFTFRPRASTRRSILDLHNLTGVVALPFLFVITLSGVLIFMSIYVPSVHTMLSPFEKAQERVDEGRTGLALHPAGRPAELASVDRMVQVAKGRWAARGIPGEVGYLAVTHVGDANSYVSVYRATTDRVATSDAVHFKASTGEILYVDPPTTAVGALYGFLTGMHLQQFEHWPLRWLFFMSGLLGCTCIATGFLFFVDKRKKRHADTGVSGARWVDALAITTITGMVGATLSMLVANRLLPVDLEGRAEWQQGVFWGTWAIALAHACWRSTPMAVARISPAWAEQCSAVALLAVGAVLANWATTGDHLVRTVGEGYWPVAGVDMALLATALMAAIAVQRIRRVGASAWTRPAGRNTPGLATAQGA